MLENKTIYDISPVISTQTAVFPGDKAFERKVSLNCQSGKDNLTLSEIHTTVHIGAHTDAPNHYHQDGVGIEERDLSLYLGRVQVITVEIERGQRIQSSDFEVSINAPRVLFKTNSFPNPDSWNEDFNALSPGLVNDLSNKGVRLIGIDTPSVDLASDRELLSHHEIYKNDMAILEGIVLANVPDGLYELIALPLPLKDADASPVRAILLGDQHV